MPTIDNVKMWCWRCKEHMPVVVEWPSDYEPDKHPPSACITCEKCKHFIVFVDIEDMPTPPEGERFVLEMDWKRLVL